MQGIRAVLFDMDGTLVDSVQAHVLTWQRALRVCQAELPAEAIHAEIGKGSDRLIRDLVGEEKALRCGDAATRLHEIIYRREFLPKLRVFPSVGPLFAELRASGCRVAIVSAAKRSELDRLVRQIPGEIDAVISGDDVAASKPDPAPWQAALRKLDLPADQALVVGDSPHDFTSASQLGLMGLGVLTGGFPEDGLLRAGARRVYVDLDFLRRDLGTWLPLPRTA